MKNGALFLALILTVSSEANAGPAARGSSMNRDFEISKTLYKVLQASAGVVPNVTASTHGSFALTVSDNHLECTETACSFQWDATSTRDTQGFQNALYDAFAKSQIVKPTVSVTGTIEYKITQANTGDEVNCFFWTPSTPYAYKECSLTVSEESGASELNSPEGKLYTELLNSSGSLTPEVQAILDLTKTATFEPESSTEAYNGAINLVRTLYTGMAVDGYQVSRNFAYAGSRYLGMRLTLTGSYLLATSQYKTEKVEIETYAIPHPGGVAPRPVRTDP